MQRNRPLVIGLLGGIGSGKSLVSSIFRKMGAEIIDADEIVRGLLKTGAVRRAYARAWGPGVLRGDGTIDPAAVARAVFGRPAQVRKLNRLIHPKVVREMRRRVRAAKRRVAVIDAPLLLETRSERMCDVLVFVDAPRAQRIRRVRETRGWTAAELIRREAAQKPLSQKKNLADHVIRNDGPASKVRAQAREVWGRILADCFQRG